MFNESGCMHQFVSQGPSDAWIQTYTGRKFFPFAPRQQDIRIVDIAHSLSMQCRFNGHLTEFYSVAEHCVHASYLVSDEAKLAALLHDAAEAYIGDMPQPVKRNLSSFCELDHNLQNAVFARFGVNLTDNIIKEVKAVDRYMLFVEAEAYLPNPELLNDWQVDRYPFTPRTPITLKAWSPAEARSAFIGRFLELRESGR